MMDSSDERGETPISTPREGDALRPETGHARQLLDAMEALLRTAHDPFAIVFKALRAVLAFDRVMVLAQTDENSIHCIAALPDELAGRSWTADNNQVQTADPCSDHESDGCWNLPYDLVGPAQPALYLPIG